MAGEQPGTATNSPASSPVPGSGHRRPTQSGAQVRGPQISTPAASADCNARDILGTIPVQQVHAWYGRLAAAIARSPVAGGGTPLASLFLNRYLSPQRTNRGGRQPLLRFTAPDYVKNLDRVQDVLQFHRRVYLTQERARIGTSRRWAGIKPRWENPGRYGWNRTDPLSMHYESLVEIPIRWQVTGNNEERDILYGLGLGFQLRTEVVARVVHPGGDHLDVTFTRFIAKVVDVYDFNYDEHITVPNPDYQSTAAGAVCPGRDKIRVYHTNARRMENASLAAVYPLESDAWTITDRTITGPGRVDL